RLLVGLILWSFFAEATTVGMGSLLEKGHILKKIFMPKWTIIVSATIHSALAFFSNLIILFIFLLFYYHIYPGVLHLLFFVIYLLLIYGISLMVLPILTWRLDLLIFMSQNTKRAKRL
ncbi:MAG: hypothetical protein ABSA76_10885, partial [Bacteroidales bacterium]